MPASPQLRFLLRAMGCLAVTLALWYMLLLDPLLGGLRIATQPILKLLPGDGSAAHATIEPDGNWLLQIPVPASVAQLDSMQQIFGRVSKDAPLVKVRSIKVPIPEKFPMLFTVSLPFFWALWVAAPRGENFLRGFLAGSGLLAVAGVLSLVFFAVHTAVVTLHVTLSGIAGFLFQAGQFWVVDVIPYAAPLLLALWLHEGLQKLVFSGDLAPAEPGKSPTEERKIARAGRGRYR